MLSNRKSVCIAIIFAIEFTPLLVRLCCYVAIMCRLTLVLYCNISYFITAPYEKVELTATTLEAHAHIYKLNGGLLNTRSKSSSIVKIKRRLLRVLVFFQDCKSLGA